MFRIRKKLRILILLNFNSKTIYIQTFIYQLELKKITTKRNRNTCHRIRFIKTYNSFFNQGVNVV